MFNKVLFLISLLFVFVTSIAYCSDENTCGMEYDTTGVSVQAYPPGHGQKTGVLRALAIFAWYPIDGGYYSTPPYTSHCDSLYDRCSAEWKNCWDSHPDTSYCSITYTPCSAPWWACIPSYQPFINERARDWLTAGSYIDWSDTVNAKMELDDLPLASILDWYNEVSYGKFKLQIVPVYGTNPITGDFDWFRPDSSSYWFHSGGTGRYDDFVKQILVKADSSIDYRQYDVEPGGPDGRVDFVFIVSGGPAYNPWGYAIVSHLGFDGDFLVENGTMKVHKELGANVTAVSRSPNTPNVWAFAHEYGHDIWGTYHAYPYRVGIDKASGPYAIMNGSPLFNGFPPSALELIQIGWINSSTPTANLKVVTSNLDSAEIGDISNSKDVRTKIYRISTSDPLEYFLISNHQKRYYSDGLRGKGVLITHVERYPSAYDIECPHGLISAFGNKDSMEASLSLNLKTRPSIEEYSYEYYDSLLVHLKDPSGTVPYHATGGPTDFFDGVRFKEFSPYTNPNTHTKYNVPTHIAVLNIHKDSIDPSVMRADFRIDYVKQPEGSFVLDGNGTAELNWFSDPVFTNPTYHNIRYRIYRSTTQGSGYTYIDSTNGVNSTTFTNTGLISDKIYYYAVKTYCSTHNCESDYGFLKGNYVNGNITTNTTWSGTKWIDGYTYIKSGATVTISNNAYIFVGSGQKIIVESGGKLIVSSGANLVCYGPIEVLAGGNLVASAGSQFKFALNIRLSIKGTFNGIGTSASPITFTYAGSNPKYWYGIIFDGGKGTVQYADIKYSSYGVWCNNTNSGVNILNCNFTNGSQCGVKMTSSGYVYVTNNNIQGGTYGVYQYKSANSTIENNTITNCNRGIFVYNSGGGIESNTISSSSYGLYIYLYSYPSLVDNLITDNTIGICSNYSSPIFYYDKDLNGVCLPNVIRNNSSRGIVVGGTIFTGLKDSHTRIYDNGGYEIMNNVYNSGTGQNQLNAEMCWWGSSTGAPPNLDSDFYPTGGVDFRPWANNTNCEFYPSLPGDKLAEITQFKQDIDKWPDTPASKSKIAIIADYLWRNGKGKDVISYLEEISTKHKGKKTDLFAMQIIIPYLQREGRNNEALGRSISIMNDNTMESETRKSAMLTIAYIYKYDFNDIVSARKIFNQFLSEYPDDEFSLIAKMELDEMGNEIESMQSTNELVESLTPNQPVKSLPSSFSLEQNYPNPFNPETNINFALPKDGHTTLRVYDITGRLIRTLINEYKHAGYYSIKWNGKNESDEIVPSGLYLYQIISGEYSSTKRMLIVK